VAALVAACTTLFGSVADPGGHATCTHGKTPSQVDEVMPYGTPPFVRGSMAYGWQTVPGHNEFVCVGGGDGGNVMRHFQLGERHCAPALARAYDGDGAGDIFPGRPMRSKLLFWCRNVAFTSWVGHERTADAGSCMNSACSDPRPRCPRPGIFVAAPGPRMARAAA
jgi:hypothetical protein